jgi:small subunit ribosomal protein S6
MRTYEFMAVFRPDVDEKTLEAAVAKLVAGDGITVKKFDVMGKKTLAYPIKKYTEGLYILATIEGAALRADEIEKRVKLGSDVLRYLLTVQEL